MGWGCSEFGYGSGWGNMHGFGGFPWFLVFGLLLVVLVYGIFLLARRKAHPAGHYNQAGSQTYALSIAQRRLAEGEITLDEFEEIRDRIQV